MITRRNFLIALGTVATVPFLSSPVYAERLKPIGDWAFPDEGQGGHGGGPIYNNGTLGGGGHVSLNNGQIEAKLLRGTWNFSSNSTIQNPRLDVQLFVEGFSSPFTFNELPANTRPFLLQQHGFNIRIILHIR
jgi:hypothetical protein